MDRIFETMDCNEIEKRRLAVFQLTYAAADWWDAERAIIGEDAAKEMTWTEFRERFLEKYFPETENHQREKEFIDLVQGNMTVQEYTTRFERLSRFAPYMVDTQKRRVRKYTQGLRSHLRRYLIEHQDRRFEDIVGMATALEQDYENSEKKGESHAP